MGRRGGEDPQGNSTLRWFCFPFPVAESKKKKAQEVT